MEILAQQVELRIVVPAVTGSSPVCLPKYARVMELAYILLLESRSCGFDSHLSQIHRPSAFVDIEGAANRSISRVVP